MGEWMDLRVSGRMCGQILNDAPITMTNTLCFLMHISIENNKIIVTRTGKKRQERKYYKVMLGS